MADSFMFDIGMFGTEEVPVAEITIPYQHQDMSDMGGNCPCGDPGNYVAVDITGLDFTIHCWCGRKRPGTFDDQAERAAFLLKHRGVQADQPG